MKIETVNGVVSATAETIEDVRALLNLAETPVAIIRKQASHLVPERYKVSCPVEGCGKRVKHLRIHIRRNHPLGT